MPLLWCAWIGVDILYGKASDFPKMTVRPSAVILLDDQTEFREYMQTPDGIL